MKWEVSHCLQQPNGGQRRERGTGARTDSETYSVSHTTVEKPRTTTCQEHSQRTESLKDHHVIELAQTEVTAAATIRDVRGKLHRIHRLNDKHDTDESVVSDESDGNSGCAGASGRVYVDEM